MKLLRKSTELKRCMVSIRVEIQKMPDTEDTLQPDWRRKQRWVIPPHLSGTDRTKTGLRTWRTSWRMWYECNERNVWSHAYKRQRQRLYGLAPPYLSTTVCSLSLVALNCTLQESISSCSSRESAQPSWVLVGSTMLLQYHGTPYLHCSATQIWHLLTSDWCWKLFCFSNDLFLTLLLVPSRQTSVIWRVLKRLFIIIILSMATMLSDVHTSVKHHTKSHHMWHALELAVH